MEDVCVGSRYQNKPTNATSETHGQDSIVSVIHRHAHPAELAPKAVERGHDKLAQVSAQTELGNPLGGRGLPHDDGIVANRDEEIRPAIHGDVANPPGQRNHQRRDKDQHAALDKPLSIARAD